MEKIVCYILQIALEINFLLKITVNTVIIYNSAPIVLLDQKNEIRSLEPSGIRLNFTLEKEREMEQILESYKNVFLEDKEISMPDISFTRGHFKRGVK